MQAGMQLPTDLMRTSDKVRALRRAGMQIGAHTVSHPILATPDRATAYSEIAISKHVLENLLGERVSLLANTDVFQLPRFTPWDRTPLRFGMRLASNLWRA